MATPGRLPEQIEVLSDIPRFHAERRGPSIAMSFGSRETTFGELDDGSNRLAQAVLRENPPPGTRVALYGKDSDRILEAILGIAKAGAVSVPVNWRLKPPEAALILRHSEARLLLIEAEFLTGISGLLADLPHLQKVVILTGPAVEAQSYSEWIDPVPSEDPRLPTSPDDVAVLVYTSGTTGQPKGVQLAHRSFFAIATQLRRAHDPWIDWKPEDITLHSVPVYHIGGLWWAMTCLSAGARLVIMNAFEPKRALEMLGRHRVTKAGFVPAMLRMLLDEPACGQTDFSSLEYLVYGGSPISMDLLQAAMRTFGCGFAQLYGLTETGNTAVCLRPEDHKGRVELLTAAGRPYPGVSVRVVDRDDNLLEPGQIGEIHIRSPATMVGYWKDEAATDRTLTDGWLRTGDAGYLDRDGYLYVCDRIKDMIICGSENVYPAEVENALCDHESVSEAAVIGIPHEQWGEAIAAFVVRKPGSSCSSADLLIHARQHLADYKVPHRVEFVDQLPRSSGGKVLKGQLREPFWQGRDRQVN